MERGADRRPGRGSARDNAAVREVPPGLRRPDDEPDAPQGLELRGLPIAVRAELKSLPPELAEIVGAHLMMAGRTIEDDPELALRHAQAARRRAARLTVTREAVAEAAYASGEWSVALTEFRALRRMTGETVWLPMMADCERALGRPQAALRLVREAADVRLEAQQQVDLLLVEAGSRADLGQTAEAVRLLRSTFERVQGRSGEARIRVGYAYADRLLAEGDPDRARGVFVRVADWDTAGITDALERVDALDGLVIETLDDDEIDDEIEGDDDQGRTDDSRPESWEQNEETEQAVGAESGADPDVDGPVDEEDERHDGDDR